MSKLEPRVWHAFLQWIVDEGARHGLGSLEAIGKHAGIDPSTIYRWEKSENGPTLTKIIAVADAIGATMSQVGAVIDHARNGDKPSPEHATWPKLDDAVTNAPDITDEEEREQIRRAILIVRAALRRK